MGVGDEPVAADLVARELVLVDQHHLQAAARQALGAGGAGRAGAHHQHIAGRR